MGTAIHSHIGMHDQFNDVEGTSRGCNFNYADHTICYFIIVWINLFINVQNAAHKTNFDFILESGGFAEQFFPFGVFLMRWNSKDIKGKRIHKTRLYPTGWKFSQSNI